MDLTSVKNIKGLLAKYDANPSKYMGQNFLIDKSVLNKIITASELTKKDTVLEIGPGLGTLTTALAENAGKVIAIEKDRMMIQILKENFKDNSRIEILEGDALQKEYNLKKYKLISNIPYYITSPIIRKFLEEKFQPDFMVLMVQKEVAQRICAKAPNMTLLSASVQFYAKPEIISYVSKECFWPAPKVDSAIIKITPHKNAPTVKPEDFFKIMKAGFLHPRKQLANNLSVGLKKDRPKIESWLKKNNIDPKQRAQTLSIKDWTNLVSSK